MSGERTRLTVAATASVVVHLFGAAMLVVASASAGTRGAERTDRMVPDDPTQDPADPVPPEKVLAGVERSDAVTITWLGFEAPEPQVARSATIDQAALSPSAGNPGPPAPASAEPIAKPTDASEVAPRAVAETIPPVKPEIAKPEIAEPTTPGEAVADLAEAQTVVSASASRDTDPPLPPMPNEVRSNAATPTAEPVPSPQLVAIAPPTPADDLLIDASTAPTGELPMPAPEPTPTPRAERVLQEPTPEPAASAPGEEPPTGPAPPETTLTPAPPRTSTPADRPATQAPAEVAPPAHASSGGGGGGETPGNPADREADAASVDPIRELRPGGVVAQEGLQIRTQRPRFSHTTVLTSVHRNPVVVVKFDRTGRVRSAAFKIEDGKTLDTGSEAVNGPVIDALYRWTATGAALEQLPKDNPNATVDYTVRLVLSVR